MTKGMVVATVDDAATVVDVVTTDEEVDVGVGETLPFDEHAARKRATPKRGNSTEMQVVLVAPLTVESVGHPASLISPPPDDPGCRRHRPG
jgi:hypothetical protein